MKNFNAKKILAAIAFLALAAFSCYWTAESLFIWQPSITRIGAWLIAVVFYVVASLCFGRFVKSLDPNAGFGEGFFKSRGGHLVFGLLGLIVFWLMFSLPTNTHTLLYRSSIRNVITTDLERTDGYLKALKDNNASINAINNKHEDLAKAVRDLCDKLITEMKHPDREGTGSRFNSIIKELENLLGVKFIDGGNLQGAPLYDHYYRQAMQALENDKADCDRKIAEIRSLMNSEKLNTLIERDRIEMKAIDDMSGVDNKTINAAVEDLINDYAYIKTYSEYLTFKNDTEKDMYTREGAMPEAKAMLSVPDVWIDFITTDKYRGHGFIWWVMLALLVDLAAFIFFDIAAKSDNEFAY